MHPAYTPQSFLKSSLPSLTQQVNKSAESGNEGRGSGGKESGR